MQSCVCEFTSMQSCLMYSVQLLSRSVAHSCPTLCSSMDCSTPGFPVQHHLLDLAQTHVIELVMPSNHLILCHPLLHLSPIFPSIKVFSNESGPHIRWPKYWSFSFSSHPSSEYLGSISFRNDWFDLLAIQGILKETGKNLQPFQNRYTKIKELL